MANINNRLWEFISHLGLNANSFGASLGYSSSEKIARLFREGKENSNPSADILSDIAEIYPDLNLNWLLTGSGNMLTKTSSQEEPKEDVVKLDEIMKAINSLATSLKTIEMAHELMYNRLDRMEILLNSVDLSFGNNPVSAAADKKDSSADANKGAHQKIHKPVRGK